MSNIDTHLESGVSLSHFAVTERSLVDLLGREYVDAVCDASAFLRGGGAATLAARAAERVDFYPVSLQGAMADMLEQVGTKVIPNGFGNTMAGAGSLAFHDAAKAAAAPLSARGYYRIGEDGRLYLVTKSEHYHTPLGHAFPGYELLDRARALGIPNATHNNTRGYITRLLEQELIRTANGLSRGDHAGLNAILKRDNDLRVLNRVLNLETGSLAAEAALKMILARFYRMQRDAPPPPYAGQIPVILVIGDDDGGLQANYHGTTVLTQMMRGMWPELHQALEQNRLWRVVPIRPNCREDIDRAFAEHETGESKIAGFFHEIVMMNYGGRRLTPEFLTHAHELCAKHDVPTVVDEIQTCLWAPQLYLFREYDLKPTFVAIGKGFPGGEYPASRILFSAAMDTMPQFGALVTNGQEEIASLAYLVTMEWAQVNSAVTTELGSYYHENLRTLVAAHPRLVEGVDGWNQMTTVRFLDLTTAKAFTADLVQRGLDISVQSYKDNCPPAVLAKLPLIADRRVIDFILAQVEDAMQSLDRGRLARTEQP